MASRYYKKPVRTKSAGEKRAKILFERQYKHERAKSVVYQGHRFRKYGAELCFINSAMALSETANHFNKMYGDNLSSKHALLIVHIKHLCVVNDFEMFTVKDLLESDFHLNKQLGYFMDSRAKMRRLIGDLVKLKFINKHGRSFIPTTRVKMFCAVMDNYCKTYFGI